MCLIGALSHTDLAVDTARIIADNDKVCEFLTYRLERQSVPPLLDGASVTKMFILRIAQISSRKMRS